MPAGTHREYRPMAERREQLLDAVVEVMRRGGVSAATTRAVTAQAGLPHGAFHYCFASKDDLFTALLERELLGSVLEALGAIIGVGDPRRGIEVALHTYLDHVRSDVDYQLLVNELTVMAVRREGGQLAREQHRRLIVRVAGHAADWSRSQGFVWTVAPAVLAGVLVTAASGLSNSWLSARDDAAADATIEAIARALGSLAARA